MPAPALAGYASSSGPVAYEALAPAVEAFAPAVTFEGAAERPLAVLLSRLLVVLEAEPGTEQAGRAHVQLRRRRARHVRPAPPGGDVGCGHGHVRREERSGP